MPYCRKCGAKLDETARFCRVCGTPVAALPVAAKPSAPARRRPLYILPVAILIAILLAVIVISALLFVPFYPVNFNQTNQVPKADVGNLRLEFQADVANVNVFFKNLSSSMIVLNVTADGNVGILEDPNRAVNVTFSHETTDNSVMINASVSQTDRWPLLYGLNVHCDVYIDSSANLTLNVRSNVGNIVMDADTETTLHIIDFETATGNINITLSKGAVSAGQFSLRTTTGNVQFQMDEEEVIGNATVSLQSTTGSVSMDLTATQRLSGDVMVNALTTTGSVNLRMVIDGDVGARIESDTTVGSITVDVERFSGNQTLLQSNSYPAGSNFLVNLKTTTGGININAAYKSSLVRS